MRHGRGMRWRVEVPGFSRQSFARKGDADGWNAKLEADRVKGLLPFDQAAGLVPYREYAAKVVRERNYTGRSRETIGSRLRSHLNPFFGDTLMRDVQNPSTHRAFLAKLRTTRSKTTGLPLSPSTVARTWDLHVVIIKTAFEDGVLPVYPLRGVKYPTVPKGRRVERVWEQPTVDTLCAGMSGRQRPIANLAAQCGHRQGEALAVSLEDIRLTTIDVTHQVQHVVGEGLMLVPPKGQKTRSVPLAASTRRALHGHAKEYGTLEVPCTCHPGVTWPVLFHRNGKLIDNSQWNESAWHPAVTKAGMTPSRATGLHQLRHFYATMMIAGGATPKEVQVWMGHASITITMDLYGHLFESATAKGRSIVEDAFGPSPTVAGGDTSEATAQGGTYPERTEGAG